MITQTCKVIKQFITNIYKDIDYSGLCSAHMEASSDPRTEGVPTKIRRSIFVYTPVFRRDVLWYGDVRPSVRPSQFSALFSYML